MFGEISALRGEAPLTMQRDQGGRLNRAEHATYIGVHRGNEPAAPSVGRRAESHRPLVPTSECGIVDQTRSHRLDREQRTRVRGPHRNELFVGDAFWVILCPPKAS